MDGFDENHDGIIDYDENGRKGFWTPGFSIQAHAIDMQVDRRIRGAQRAFLPECKFFPSEILIKTGTRKGTILPMNTPWGISLLWHIHCQGLKPYTDDFFIPGMRWGQGMWPSWQQAFRIVLSNCVYGGISPIRSRFLLYTETHFDMPIRQVIMGNIPEIGIS